MPEIKPEPGTVRLRVMYRLNVEGSPIADKVVALPASTRMDRAELEVRRRMKQVLGTGDFRVSGVQLYPHWNREALCDAD